MIIDAHLHCSAGERSDDVLRSLDDAGVDVGILLAPFLSPSFSLDPAASLQHANAHLAALVRGRGDRLAGFAVVDPRRRIWGGTAAAWLGRDGAAPARPGVRATPTPSEDAGRPLRLRGVCC